MNPITPTQEFIDFARKLNDEQASAVWKALCFIDNEAPFVLKQNLDKLKAAIELTDEEE